MAKKMIINARDSEEVRIAILGEAGVLQDLDIESRDVKKNKGNIYKGIVKAIEPSLNAAFVNYGADKEGFLTASDVDPKLNAQGTNGDRAYRITDLVNPKQSLLVQVEKDEVGNKGAVLTTFLSLAGRYLVLMPGARRHGVSRRIADEDTRNQMREAASRLKVPESMGVIIRTASLDRTKQDLNRDLKVLLRMWENLKKESERAKTPTLILKEQDVIIRALRDYFFQDIDEIVVDSDEAYDRAAEYMSLVMPRQKSLLTRYVERRPIFNHYRIEPQIEALYSNRVLLHSGGSIVVEPTEALVAIDVNSGKQKTGGHEETALRTNLEAAQEIARQLRLRDLGGIVVIDFIDMMSRRNNQAVEKELKQALKPDKARIKVSRISSNGTMELTRQRLRSSLDKSVFRRCEVCHGTGHTLSPASHALAVLRKIRDRAAYGDLKSVRARLEPEAAQHLLTEKSQDTNELASIYNIQIEILPDDDFAAGQDEVGFAVDPAAAAVSMPEPDFGPPATLNTLTDDDATKAETTKKTKTPRRRGRRSTRTRKAEPPPKTTQMDDGEAFESPGPDGPGSFMGLPTFELIDLATFNQQQTGTNGKAKSTRSDEAAARGSSGKRRSRRGGRRRKRPAEKAPTAEPTAETARAAGSDEPAQALGGIRNFFRRLFGAPDIAE